MADEEQLMLIEQVTALLIARYPAVSDEHIAHAVRIAHKRFDCVKVRSFVPILVEKVARRDIEKSLSDLA